MDRVKNLPLIIILVIVVIIALVLSIVKASTISKEVNANTDIEQEQVKQSQNEQQEENLVVEIETEENVQEIFDEEKEEEKEQQGEEQKNQAKYFIRINYAQNVVTVYEKDSEGKYTKAVKAMVCSTGTATPKSGTYSISDKYKWGKLFGGVSGQYCTRIVKSILFHSVPYLTYGDKGSLEYWEYDKLGTKASAGCIRLTVEDAKWIYQNCTKGTQVEFYADFNPGPLGKPTAQKISKEEAVRGWDPTDPDENNPWKTYIKEEPGDEASQGNEYKPTIPSTPVNPEPAEPEIPTDSEKPETPAEPTNPEPEEPETPEEPTNPEPEEPETPEEPTNPEPEQPDTSTDNQTTETEITTEKEV